MAKPATRHGISPRKIVLHGCVPEGEYWAASAGDYPFKEGELLQPGSPLRKSIPAWYFPELAPEPEIPFDYTILHEDPELVVVDKPHFLPATSNGKLVRNTVQTRLRIELDDPTISPLHRLDRLTAGLLVCGRGEDKGFYQRQFERREVEKLYIARVQRTLCGPEWQEVRVKMHKPRGSRQVLVGQGRETVTWMRALDDVHLELRPNTGHTHQLRALLNHLGMPIIGDDTYPEDRQLPLDDFNTPLQLFATEISLHGRGGEVLRFASRVADSGFQQGRG